MATGKEAELYRLIALIDSKLNELRLLDDTRVEEGIMDNPVINEVLKFSILFVDDNFLQDSHLAQLRTKFIGSFHIQGRAWDKISTLRNFELILSRLITEAVVRCKRAEASLFENLSVPQDLLLAIRTAEHRIRRIAPQSPLLQSDLVTWERNQHQERVSVKFNVEPGTPVKEIIEALVEYLYRLESYWEENEPEENTSMTEEHPNTLLLEASACIPPAQQPLEHMPQGLMNDLNDLFETLKAFDSEHELLRFGQMKVPNQDGTPGDEVWDEFVSRFAHMDDQEAQDKYERYLEALDNVRIEITEARGPKTPLS